MEKQDWQGKQLDKDILCVGNKIYSPETCAFVDITTNHFTTDRKSGRGNWPLGVDLHSASTKFRAQCSNRILGYSEHLGYFDCPNKAHLAWKRRKHELACQLADLQSDSRVAAALRIRYL